LKNAQQIGDAPHVREPIPKSQTYPDIQLRTRKSPHRAALQSVHSLDAFVFTVPDLGEAQRFYERLRRAAPGETATGSTCTPPATRTPGVRCTRPAA
jgi:hypothetical protein